MNSICGVVYWHGEPVAGRELRRMSEACWRPAEGRRYWVNGSVGMGSASWQTTPEERSQQQPLVSTDNRFVVVADARLDHRDELIAALRSGSSGDTAPTDIELILMAYLRWANGCGEHLFGDYAFAIWDRHEQRLLCVRDAFGAKPLFYSYDQHRLLFASTISQLLTHRTLNVEVDNLAVARYFTGRPADYLTENTYYRGIHRIAPAHALAFTQNGNPRRTRYWDIDRNRRLHYEDPCQYAEEFRALLTESVKWCSRSQTPLAVTASGGMDSTSVAVLLAKQQGPPIRLYSITYGEGHAADESGYVQDLAARCQSKPTFIKGLDHLPYINDPLAAHPYDEPPPYWDDPVWYALFGTAARDGCRVTTLGVGGDALFLVQPYVFGDYLRHGQVGLAVREFHAWQKRRDRRLSRTDVTMFLSTVLPARLLAWRLRKESGLSRWLSPQLIAECRLDPDWTKRSGLYDRHGFGSWHQSKRYWYLTDWKQPFQESLHRLASTYGIEARDPFQDRKIVEYALALPPEQCLHRGERKHVLRNAMSGILPVSINKRDSKTEFSSVVLSAIRSWTESGRFEPASQWKCCQQGYVDCGHLQATLDRCTTPQEAGSLRELGKTLLFERWLAQVNCLHNGDKPK